ncbi:MAG: OmpA family protein [Methylococcales bacterium]|nr:OmpA family protein [Methylococcales bacterium]
MSALLVVFILAAVALIIELTETQKKIEQDIQQLQNAEKARKDILHDIKTELAKQNIVVVIADNDTVLRIPETTLSFASNKFDIPKDESLRHGLRVIGKVLHQTINKPFNEVESSLKRFEYLDTVFIEGHTDSRFSKRIKGNWGLSAYRAISLWEFWSDELSVTPSFASMQNAFDQNLFSVSGYAASRRIQLVEDTPKQRAANRRIDIRFTVKRPSIAQLEVIVKQ